MIEKSFGLIYVLRPTRKGGNQKALFARITVDGDEKEISMKRTWDAKRWCQKSYTATGNKEDARELNNYLQTFTMKVHQARKYLMDTDDVITVEKIKNIIVDTAGKQHFLLQEFEAYNERLKSLIGTDYRPRTVQRYVTTKNHLAEFIKFKFGKDDVPLTYITESFVADLEHWFKSEKKNIHNSTVKNLGNFRKVVAYCRKQKWIKTDPFTETNMTLKQTKIIPLNATELFVLSNKPLATERLSVIRDVFVFSCYTGLSYSDVEL
ncbi:site-specific integrase [Nubsella zeaxanthinifaciens]|uniref:phage integrase SAM-like domain and Arm DNA-binding domain-containing protein n=1 Tax=Nubsella zeaxanthinifaciens TaxID=392412 RepID=UPI003D046459